VGDAVVEFSSESAFSGNRIVIEAKRSAAYTVGKALAEMKVARENRKADVGVFVMASSRAGESFPVMSRHGADVLVQWDMDDHQTDAYLHAAIMLALGLVARTKASRQDGQIDELNDINLHIGNELDRITKTRKFNDNIRRSCENIEVELGRANGSLERLLKKAQNTLQALGVNILERELHAEEPVVLSGQVDACSEGLQSNMIDISPISPIAERSTEQPGDLAAATTSRIMPAEGAEKETRNIGSLQDLLGQGRKRS
jgi:hypothetical protein